MSATDKKKSKIKFIILGAVALLAVALFAAKLIIENKAAQRVREDLALLDSFIKLENADVKVSLLSSSITSTNIVYSFADAPGLLLKIGAYTESGVDINTLLGCPGDLTTIDSSVIEKLSVEAKDIEVPLLELEYYEIRDLAYNYRDMRQMLLENKGTGDPLAVISKLMPLLGDMRTGKDMGRNLKLNAMQLDLFDLNIGSFATSGQSELNKESTGFDMGISNMRMSDITLNGEDAYSGAPYDAKLAEVSMHGLKYNYKAMLEALGSYQDNQDPLTLLMAIIPSLYDYEFEKFEMKNLEATYESALFKLASVELGKRTLKEQGPNILRGMSLKYGPMDVFSLEEAGMGKFVLSDRLVDIIKNPSSVMNDNTVLNEFSTQPYNFIKGSKIENFYLKNLNARNMVRLGNWRTDIDLADRANVKSAVAALFISQDALRQLQMITAGEPGLPHMVGALAEKEGGVTLDADLGVDLLVEKELSGTVTYALSEPTLLETKLAADIITGKPRMYQTYGDPLMRRMEFYIADKGWHDFAMAHDLYGGNTMSGLDEEIAKAKPAHRQLLQAIRAFLKTGGTLQVNMAPLEPIEFDYLDEAVRNVPEALGISATHTPPAVVQ